jgi:hypothetical protein
MGSPPTPNMNPAELIGGHRSSNSTRIRYRCALDPHLLDALAELAPAPVLVLPRRT